MFAVLLSSLGQHVLRAAASVVVLAVVIQLIQKLKSHKHAHDQKTHCDPIAVQQQTTHHVSVWNCNNEVHVSGARGTVHVMGEGSQMVAGGLSEQAAQALHNIKSVVEVAVLHQSPKGASSPLSFADVDEALRPDGRDYLRQCRVVMPIKNATPAAVAEVERVFATFLTGALSTPVCAFETTDSLPLGVLVEIDCVAKLPNASPMRRISPLLAGPALPVTV